MELNEFITKVLVDIHKGVKNANDELENRPFEIEPFNRDKATGFISFDIAVKTIEGGSKGVKGGIEVLNIGIGGKSESSSLQENANRIKFYILPSRRIG